MKRIVFGIVLGLLVAVPPLLAVLTTALTFTVSQPPLLVGAAGAWAWPHITHRVRRWTR
jgi:hypothetical protein